MKPCNQCGKCCLKHSAGAGLGSASEADMAQWENHRAGVLDYVQFSDLWVSPRTGEETQRCPWLRKLPNQQKFKCRIHEVRPDTCNHYPVDVDQMIEDGCEMLEGSDLKKPRHELEKELKGLRNESESVRWHRT